MADRIKGITIEIGGDTSKLSDSLKDVNKNIKDTQASLKDVDKLLKLDPSNIELLTQKQELLTKATADTKEKLDKLKAAQEQMKASGVDETSKEYQALEREIVATEQEMKKLGEESKATNKKILEVSSGAEKLAKSTDKMAKATKGLSKFAGGTLATLTGLGVKAAKDADDLNTLSKQTGLSTKELQKMAYASDLIDVSVDDITGAFKRMKKQLDSGEEKFEAIGVHTKDMNGNLRDSETVFYEVVRALGNIENETERDVVAMDIFGKSADDLAGLLDDGGKAFRQLGYEAEQNGSIISQEELDKANELNDTLDKLKQQLGTSFSQLGVTIAEALLPLLESLTPMIQTLADKIKEMDPDTVKVLGVILALVAALSPVLSIISKLLIMFPIIAAGIQTVITVVGGFVAAIGGPVLLAIVAVVAAIVVWIKNWDDIKLAAQLALEIIVEYVTKAFDKIKELIGNLVEAFREKFPWLSQVVDMYIDNIKTKFENFKTIIKGAIETVKGLLSGQLKFPDIKMPHFSFQGKFSLNPPSVPKFKVEWYKKAYDDAYLLNSPTIFGASGGQLLGGGEGNGSEAVVGTDKLMSMISEVVGNQSVKVVLEGDAAGVFNLVRIENSKFMKSNGGYSPLVSN